MLMTGRKTIIVVGIQDLISVDCCDWPGERVICTHSLLDDNIGYVRARYVREPKWALKHACNCVRIVSATSSDSESPSTLLPGQTLYLKTRVDLFITHLSVKLSTIIKVIGKSTETSPAPEPAFLSEHSHQNTLLLRGIMPGVATLLVVGPWEERGSRIKSEQRERRLCVYCCPIADLQVMAQNYRHFIQSIICQFSLNRPRSNVSDKRN